MRGQIEFFSKKLWKLRILKVFFRQVVIRGIILQLQVKRRVFRSAVLTLVLYFRGYKDYIFWS